MNRRWGTIGILGLALLIPAAAIASTAGPRGVQTIGDDFRISGARAVSWTSTPAVAYNTALNQFLVVWHDYRDGPDRSYDVYGRLLTGDGLPLGGDFRISSASATGGEIDPDVAYNSIDDEYLVVWSDNRRLGDRGMDVYGRKIDADGTPRGGEFTISGSSATGHERRPAVAYSTSRNQYLVVWYDTRSAGAAPYQDIYGRRLKATGRPAGEDFRISGTGADGDEALPQIAYNPVADQYLVVWMDHRDQPERGYDVYGRRIKGGGRLAGDDFLISGDDAVDSEYDPAVAFNTASNSFLVVWADTRGGHTRGADIFGRKVKAGGRLAGDAFRISGPAATGDEWEPHIAHNPADDRFLVVWKDLRDELTRGVDTYGRRVKAGGRTPGDDFRISGEDAIGDEFYLTYHLDLAANPTDDLYLTVFHDWRDSDSRKSDIYGRLVRG